MAVSLKAADHHNPPIRDPPFPLSLASHTASISSILIDSHSPVSTSQPSDPPPRFDSIPNPAIPTMSVPPTQTAIITLANGNLTIAPTLPTPSPHAPDTLLVRTHAFALNPADHKMSSRLQTPDLVAGSDFAGTIVAIGRDVSVLSSRPGCAPWAVGDRVCGAVHGCNVLRPRDGAFAQWVEADPVVLVRLPEWWGWDEGAALGGSCVGAVGLGLFWEMGLERPEEGGGGGIGHVVARGQKAELRLTVLVYGGSTACGTMALQILRL